MIEEGESPQDLSFSFPLLLMFYTNDWKVSDGCRADLRAKQVTLVGEGAAGGLDPG